jgi:hypothetical protein
MSDGGARNALASPPMKRLLALGLALGLLLLAGCTPSDDDPARAFQIFLADVQEGKADAAWALHSADTQAELTELIRQRSEESKGAIPNDPKKVLFGNAELAKPVERVEVKSREGAAAVLTVTHVGGGTQDIPMVKEPTGWKLRIELPPGLKQ